MSNTTDRIESDLNQTRDAIHDTINALGQKLSPGQLIDELIGLAKGQTGVFASNLGRQVRDNPLPAALIGAGVAMYILNRNSHGGASHAVLSADDWNVEERYRRVEQARWGTVRNPNESEDDFKSRLADAQGLALQLKQNAGEAIHQFRERIAQAVTSLEQSAQATRERVGAAFSGAVHFAKDQVAHAKHAGADAVHSAEDMYQANPLAAGAIALGIGALIGGAVPLSSAERDTLKGVADEATRLGADLAQRGAQAVEQRATALN
ncbi:MAG: DUF3618 domain-containing protein [Terricaulis sp.]